jgi:hypothetical protein
MAANQTWRQTWITLTTIVCLAGSMAAADTWIETDASGAAILREADAAHPPVLTVANSDSTGLRVTVHSDGVLLKPRTNRRGESFVELSWPDAAVTGDIGTPSLPVVRQFFVTPYGATPVPRVTVESVTTIDATVAGFPLVAWPVQPPVEKLPGALERAVFQLDEAVYASDVDLLAERASVQYLGMMSGQQLWQLEIYPVSYNPARQSVDLCHDITVDITFLGGMPRDAVRPLPMLRKLVLNPEVLPAADRPSGNYLIVVASTHASGIAAFANAKANQGYTVSTYTVAPGTTKETIRAYIQSLYGGPNSPDYVLLVGDTDTIPAWTGGGEGSPPTDLPYVCMDGASDWYPDIPLGRFPASTATHLTSMIDKTLYYENGAWADPLYVKRAVFMASEDNYTVSEGTHNYCINNYMTPNGFTSDRLYCHTYNATTQQVRNAFNDGRFYGVYSGHGSETSWADGPPFSQSDVNGLTNANMYACVYSFACLTGNYTVSECFMETWVRVANKGAAVATGSTVTSYWTEDDVLQKRLFDAIFDPNQPEVPKQVGPILIEAKMRYLAQMGSGSTTRRYFEMYNIMGDPSLSLAGATPPHGMGVTPANGLSAQGQVGGPFTPNSITFTIENFNDTPITYQVTNMANWLTVTNTSGTLAGHQTTQVIATINSRANILGTGNYADTIRFINLTDHDGDTNRSVTLKVGFPTKLYEWTLDSNPGWPTQGQWAFGRPTGQGGTYYGRPDPTSGYTGLNVYGVNLNGDYSTTPGGPYYVTLGPVSLVNTTETKLKFRRWLNSDYQPYAYATVHVSNNGSSWTRIWQNGTTEYRENAWSLQEYDISSIANNQATVWVRWGYEIRSGAWPYSGWNIDDIEIWGLPLTGPVYPAGDMNCDGEVTYADIDLFVEALQGESAWSHPNCPWINADMNGDGEVTYGDIDPFVAAIGSGG